VLGADRGFVVDRLHDRPPAGAPAQQEGAVDVEEDQSLGHGFGAPGGASEAAAHLAHSTTPLKVHIRQMNVPHFAHGYPSEARSSRPQARQIIASTAGFGGESMIGSYSVML
jgi:hypothetical protein